MVIVLRHVESSPLSATLSRFKKIVRITRSRNYLDLFFCCRYHGITRKVLARLTKTFLVLQSCLHQEKKKVLKSLVYSRGAFNLDEQDLINRSRILFASVRLCSVQNFVIFSKRVVFSGYCSFNCRNIFSFHFSFDLSRLFLCFIFSGSCVHFIYAWWIRTV